MAARRHRREGPEAPDVALARLYDEDLVADDPGDLGLYLGLAERTGGPVLELAAGSGRVAVPLAEAGHDVTAVDLDPAMLARADDRAIVAGVAARVRLVEADLLDLELVPAPDAGAYRLAILALNSIFLLATAEAQAAALRVMAGHLAPGGLAVVDAWQPVGDDLALYDGRLQLADVRVDAASGRTVTKVWAASHDRRARTVVLTTIYDEGEPGAPAARWVRRDALRLVAADELVAMAEAAGLRVEVLAGDYDLRPRRGSDDQAVLVARR